MEILFERKYPIKCLRLFDKIAIGQEWMTIAELMFKETDLFNKIICSGRGVFFNYTYKDYKILRLAPFANQDLFFNKVITGVDLDIENKLSITSKKWIDNLKVALNKAIDKTGVLKGKIVVKGNGHKKYYAHRILGAHFIKDDEIEIIYELHGITTVGSWLGKGSELSVSELSNVDYRANMNYYYKDSAFDNIVGRYLGREGAFIYECLICLYYKNVCVNPYYDFHESRFVFPYVTSQNYDIDVIKLSFYDFGINPNIQLTYLREQKKKIEEILDNWNLYTTRS
ncbi:MAG: hypothetical protein NTY88_12025 [Bacteroidetes bacterium]|nr:hypothetical protein [Bacteroidota bacterium]